MAYRGAEVAVCIIAAAALRIDDVLEGGRHRTRMRVLHPLVCTHMHARVSQAPAPAPGCFHLISFHLISFQVPLQCNPHLALMNVMRRNVFSKNTVHMKDGFLNCL